MSKSGFWCFLAMWEALVRFLFHFFSDKMHLAMAARATGNFNNRNNLVDHPFLSSLARVLFFPRWSPLSPASEPTAPTHKSSRNKKWNEQLRNIIALRTKTEQWLQPRVKAG